MPEILREINSSIHWYPHARCFRFAYRDPYNDQRKFLNCLPNKFAKAGIILESPEQVRRDTFVSRKLAEKLRAAFLRSMAALVAEGYQEKPPLISRAIEEYFILFDTQSAVWRKGLRWLFESFQAVVGDKPVDRIRDVDLKLFEKHVAKTCSRNTTRSYMKRVAMLITFAFRKGWLRVDPRLTYRLPKDETIEPNPFTHEEIARYFDICRTKGRSRGWGNLEFLGAGMLTLGLRPVEAIHARWENVNWQDRMLWIGKSHAGKERQAIQYQPIPLILMPFLERHRKDEGAMFSGYLGEPLSEGAYNRARKSVTDHMKGFTWRRFRKTYATRIFEAGHDGFMVSRLLRHSLGGRNISIAQRHYVGQDLKRLRDVVDAAFAGIEPLKQTESALAREMMGA